MDHYWLFDRPPPSFFSKSLFEGRGSMIDPPPLLMDGPRAKKAPGSESFG